MRKKFYLVVFFFLFLLTPISLSEELISERTLNSKTYDLGNSKYSFVNSVAPIHYQNSTGDYLDINMTIKKVDNAQLDGWTVTQNGWHYALGQPGDKSTDGWVGFGGKEGQNWFKFRLIKVGYYHYPNETWDDIGGSPDYNRSDLSKSNFDELSGRANWANIWTTPGGGQLNLSWFVDGTRLKEEILINQEGREWIKNNRPPSTPTDETYFGYILKLDWSDIPKVVKNGTEMDINTTFEDDNLTIEFRDSLDELLGFMPLDYAYVGSGRNMTKLSLKKRFYEQNSNHFLLVGARVDHLNQMPDGTLVFDPSVNQQVNVDNRDAYSEGNTQYRTDNSFPWDNAYLGEDSNTIHGAFSWITSIPQGVDISACNITIDEGTDTNINSFTFDVFGYDVDNVTEFDGSGALNNEFALTSNSVAETASTGNHITNDLSAVCEEITNRTGFGGNLGFVFETNADASNEWYSWCDLSVSGSGCSGASTAPRLRVEYTHTPFASSSNSTNDTSANSDIEHRLRWDHTWDLSGHIFSFFNDSYAVGLGWDDGGTSNIAIFYKDGTFQADTFLVTTTGSNDLLGYNGTYTIPSGFKNEDILGFAYDAAYSDFAVFFRNGSYSTDTSQTSFGSNVAFTGSRSWTIPTGFNESDIVGFAFHNGANDIAVFFRNGSYVSDTNAALTDSTIAFTNLETYTINSGKDHDDIVGVFHHDGGDDACLMFTNGDQDCDLQVTTFTSTITFTDNSNTNTIGDYDIGFVNDTWTSMTGTTNWSNVTKHVNNAENVKLRWCVYANDTFGDWNGSTCENPFSYYTTTAPAAEADVTSPTYSTNSTNATVVSTPCLFSLQWTDETALSGYIFETNNTGSLTNDTWTTMSGTTDWSNVTKTLNGTEGAYIEWRVYANDSSDNWNTSQVYSLTTTTATVDYNRTQTESMTLSETLAELYDFDRKNTDTFTYSESASEVSGFTRALLQSMSYSEITQRLRDLEQILTDSQTFSESIQTLTDRLSILTDSLSFGEVIQRILAARRVMTDSMVFGELISSYGLFPKSLIDSLSYGETVQSETELGRILTDTLSINEIIDRSLDLIRIQTDSFTFGEIIQRLRGLFSVQTDTITWGETINTSQPIFSEYTRTQTDYVIFSEIQKRMSDFTKSPLDSLSLGESILKIPLFQRQNTDGITFSESITRVKLLEVIMTDVINYNQILVRSNDFIRILRQILGFNELIEMTTTGITVTTTTISGPPGQGWIQSKPEEIEELMEEIDTLQDKIRNILRTVEVEFFIWVSIVTILVIIIMIFGLFRNRKNRIRKIKKKYEDEDYNAVIRT